MQLIIVFLKITNTQEHRDGQDFVGSTCDWSTSSMEHCDWLEVEHNKNISRCKVLLKHAAGIKFRVLYDVLHNINNK